MSAVSKLVSLGALLIGALDVCRSLAAATTDCRAPTTVPQQLVEISTRTVTRPSVPPALFGFDLPWYDAQIGYMRSGTIRPELVEWLRPFRGAIYRYPAGSNSFEWRKAIGRRSARRPVLDQYAGMAPVELGPAEFLAFMNLVDGQPLWMLNTYGHSGRIFSAAELRSETLDYMTWIYANAPRLCGSSGSCNAHLFELGNELDTSVNWTARRYVATMAPLLQEARERFPHAKFVVLGKSAPWDAKSGDNKAFDTEVAAGLANLSDGVSFHSYYDGLSIPTMTDYISQLSATFRKYKREHKVYITEHARWPSKPSVGRWEETWFQASGSGGGVSSADFILSLVTDDKVAAAVWHALGVKGPWQMVKWDPSTDKLYPSPAYWAQRVLREAFLTDAVAVSPSLVTGSSYVGGYDLRFVAMRGDGGRVSLLGVNRGRVARTVVPRLDGSAIGPGYWVVRMLVADERGSDNTHENKDRFVMQTTKPSVVDGRIGVCVPPNAVFSLANF